MSITSEVLCRTRIRVITLLTLFPLIVSKPVFNLFNSILRNILFRRVGARKGSKTYKAVSREFKDYDHFWLSQFTPLDHRSCMWLFLLWLHLSRYQPTYQAKCISALNSAINELIRSINGRNSFSLSSTQDKPLWRRTSFLVVRSHTAYRLCCFVFVILFFFYTSWETHFQVYMPSINYKLFFLR